MANVLLIGTGAIGSIYAYFLTTAGAKVTTVCRSNFDAVSTKGIEIQSRTLGMLKFRPHCTVHILSDTTQQIFEYIVITTKSVNIDALIDDLKKASVVTTASSIVLIQNGIGIEEPFRSAFPDTQIVSGVVYLPCAQHAPGVIFMNGPDVLELGHYPASPPSTELHEFNRLLTLGGATSTIHEDVQRYRWKKSLINGVWNPIAALTLNLDSDFLGTHTDAYALCRSLMLEVLSVAHAEGYRDLTERDIDMQLDRAVQRRQSGTGIKMSMLVDVEADRPMETEAILGNLVRKADKLGVQVAGLKMLYLLINAREVQRAKMVKDRE